MKAGARQYDKELNYQEACNESYVAFAQAGLPGQVQDLINSPEVLLLSTCVVLHVTVMQCAVLYCSVLYMSCTVLCRVVLYHTVLQCAVVRSTS